MVQSKEEYNEERRKYYANPENKAKKKTYYQSKKSEILARRKEHSAKPENKTRRKERDSTPQRKARMKELYNKLKTKVYAVYSKRHSNSEVPCCRCCGEKSHTDFLTVDHVDGRKIMGHNRNFNGTQLWRELKKKGYPEGFQILCWNCNMAKGFYGICPHQLDKMK